MDIYKVFTCEAAHRLTGANVPEKCARLHGHSFRIEVWLRGPVGTDTGWVMDFADVACAFRPIYEQLDHHYLNEIEGLSNPSAENLALWIWHRLRPSLPMLSKIVVHDTCTSGCIYQGEEE